MTQITAGEAAKILGISKRTLYRWEDEGRIRSVREGILNVRVFDRNYIQMAKRILDLDKQEKEHLAKLPKIIEQVKEHSLLHEVKRGQPLKIMFQEEFEAGAKAIDTEEAWMAEHKRLLDELFSFPRKIIREVLKI